MTDTAQPTRLQLGEGKISGYVSIFLGLISLAGVLCFHFPEYLTSAELRAHYSVDVLRAVLFVCLMLAYAFGLVSTTLGDQWKVGFIGLSISTIAVLLGGTGVEVDAFESGPVAVSLDWLLIDILALSAIFIPIELFWPKRREQTKFHIEWRTDLVYFAVGHLLLQYTAVVIQSPAEALFGGMGLAGVHEVVSSLPIWVQVPLAMFVADIVQYAVHRVFHTVPFLWRFHAVHHSIHTVDWMAGSRLHLVDILVTRSLSYMPLYVLGFSAPAFYIYVAIVSLQAVAAHANTRLSIGPLKHLLVTPQFHHWHHSDDPTKYDKNFAIHFPIIDRLFETYYMPGEEWPPSMGLGSEPMPKGYLRQLAYPFQEHADSTDCD